METPPKKRYLLPLPNDDRDLSRHKIFGSLPLAQITNEDFLVAPPVEIMNQDINYNSDFCAAYALAGCAEAQDGIPFVPEYTFAKAKQIIIENLKRASTDQEKQQIIDIFGLNLRDICDAAVKYGFLEREHDPFECNTTKRPERNFIADYRNWPAELDSLAWEHAKNTYLSVDGPYDTFDNFRACLVANRDNRETIITGAMWRESWSKAFGGLISDDIYNISENGSGHAFEFIGQANTEKGLCLVAQLSDGENFGENGLFYFTRSVVNREFTFGAFHFSNISKEKARIHNDFNFTVDAGMWQKFWKVALYLITYFKK